MIQEARGVCWDRIAWTWRGQTGDGRSVTAPTWSECMDALEKTRPIEQVFTVQWNGFDDWVGLAAASTELGESVQRTRRQRRRQGP